MTETQAKKHLGTMIRSFTTGTVLHLLAELFREKADEAKQAGDDLAVKQCHEIAATLFVVGLGVDAARPTN